MSEENKNKYLDLVGLKQYDALIKNFITSSDSDLAKSIAALNAKIGNLELEGSDSKNLAEIVEEIYSSIAELVVAQESLEAKDAELEAKDKDLASLIKGIRDDLEYITGSSSENEATIGEINGKVDALTELVNKNIEDIAAANDAAEQALVDAKAYADGLAGNYDAAGTAAGLNAAMNDRVVKLEAIDHDKLAADAAADAVAAVVAGADSDFDTLKDVAEWIGSHKEGAAELQVTVSNHTESINTLNTNLSTLNTKVDGDIANLTQHITDAAQALAQVETSLDARIDVLEAFEETHSAIGEDDITNLFNQQQS